MAIIIKGRMPTKCGECRFCNEFGDYPVCIAIPMKVEADEIFPKGCPILHEIPDEHGRLIDADTLADYFFKYLAICFHLMNMEKTKEMVDNVKEALKIAPTVLEASN